MPRKTNKRKVVQAAKRKADADLKARQNRRWETTRRNGGGVAVIAHHHPKATAALLAQLIIADLDKGRTK